MMEKLQETYLVTKDELCILMQAAGCKEYFGFTFFQKELNPEEITRVLYQMSKNGFIFTDGETFFVNKELSEILNGVKQAKKVLVVTEEHGQLPTYCCYLGSKLFISEWMTQRKNTVKWRTCEKQELFQTLLEDGFLTGMWDVCLVLYDCQSKRELGKLSICWQGKICTIKLETPLQQEIYPFHTDTIRLMLDRLLQEDEQPEWRCL